VKKGSETNHPFSNKKSEALKGTLLFQVENGSRGDGDVGRAGGKKLLRAVGLQKKKKTPVHRIAAGSLKKVSA